MTQKRVFSGAQPSSSSMHLGNYFGALKQWVDLQNEYETIYCVVDQHAITVDHSAAHLYDRSLLTAAQYLAVGVDPEKSIVFIQSDVSEHSQLMWILSCITGMGEAGRMTQYKDKSQKEGSDKASVGLFTYPILQAADILLYNTDLVPVGEDQRQHIELTRDLGQRFNYRFGDTFVIPDAYILKENAKIYDVQNPRQKMSKSATNSQGTISLLDDDKVIAQKIKSAVTDDQTDIIFDEHQKPGVSNLLTIYSQMTQKSISQLESEYQDKMYGHLKVDLVDAAIDYLKPIRQKVHDLLDDKTYLEKILEDGAERARQIAAPHLAEIYTKVGFKPGI